MFYSLSFYILSLFVISSLSSDMRFDITLVVLISNPLNESFKSCMSLEIYGLAYVKYTALFHVIFVWVGNLF